MRPRTAASLACRIIALWLGVNVVMQTVSAVILTDGRIGSLGQFWAVIGTQAAVAWLLWIGATGLGGAMAPDVAGDPPVPRSNVEIHTIALSVVGVVLVVEAIPALIAIAVSGPDIGPFGPLSLPGGDFGFFDRSAGLVANVVKLAIGSQLALRARGLAGWLARRYPEPPQPDGPAGPAEPNA
jgi:hypothetical protein